MELNYARIRGYVILNHHLNPDLTRLDSKHSQSPFGFNPVVKELHNGDSYLFTLDTYNVVVAEI